MPPEDVAAYRPTLVISESTPMAMIPAEQSLTDSQISDAVYRQFERDPGIDDRQVYVTTNDGIVQLSGKVTDLLSKERVAHVAEAVRGVRAVSNQIELDIPKRDDRQITQDVSDAFLVNAATDSFDIHPTSKDGTVSLRGNVASWQERALAERLAKGVRGVRAVEDDDIHVTYPSLRSDPEIQADVKSRLRWDTQVDGDHITVSVGGATVFLRGAVGSAEERYRASADAWVTGVRSVDVSGILIDSSATRRDVRTSNAAHPSDADIAQAIKDAALYDPRIKSFNVQPKVTGGVVTLLGIVDNLQAKAAAESVARHTVGAMEVRNEIQVRASKPETDQARQERIESALAISPITEKGDIHVKVVDGEATLTGSVANYFVSAQASEMASQVSGVVRVQDELRVTHPDEGDVYGSSDAAFDPYLESFTYLPRKALHSDEQIAGDVKSALSSTPYVEATGVAIRVQGGTVTLTGTVDNWKQRSAATRDAFEGGAVAVHNDLQVR
jgi:osmotically-inducible protein OsmY